MKQVDHSSSPQDDGIRLKSKFDPKSFDIHLDDMGINLGAFGNSVLAGPTSRSSKDLKSRLIESDVDAQNRLGDDTTDITSLNKTTVVVADYYCNNDEQEEIGFVNNFDDIESNMYNVLYKLSFLSPPYPSSPVESPPRPSTPDINVNIITSDPKLDDDRQISLDDKTVSSVLDRIEIQIDQKVAGSKFCTQIRNKVSESFEDLKPAKGSKLNEILTNTNKSDFQTKYLNQQYESNNDLINVLGQISKNDVLVKGSSENNLILSKVVEDPKLSISENRNPTVLSEEAPSSDHFINDKRSTLKANPNSDTKATDFLINFNRQQSQEAYSYSPRKHVGVFKYFCSPPLRNEILNTLSQYGIAHAKYEEPFCSITEDLPSASL